MTGIETATQQVSIARTNLEILVEFDKAFCKFDEIANCGLPVDKWMKERKTMQTFIHLVGHLCRGRVTDGFDLYKNGNLLTRFEIPAKRCWVYRASAVNKNMLLREWIEACMNHDEIMQTLQDK